MKNKVVYIVFLVSMILLAVGLSFYKDYQSKYQPFEVSNNPTADWKTYTNSKYNYEFKYPQSLNFEVRELFPQKEQDQKPDYVTKNMIISENKDFVIYIDSYVNSKSLNLIDWLNYTQDSKASVWNNYTSLKINRFVDGMPAFGYWDNAKTRGEKPDICRQACPIYTLTFTKGDKAYHVDLVFYVEYTKEINDLFDQILSTFKFTN